jgi:hypothetical protein
MGESASAASLASVQRASSVTPSSPAISRDFKAPMAVEVAIYLAHEMSFPFAHAR